MSTATTVRVAPLVRVARWSFLGLGILYGTKRWNSLHAKEEKRREYLREMRPIWDAEEAERKKQSALKEAAEFRQYGIDLGSS